MGVGWSSDSASLTLEPLQDESGVESREPTIVSFGRPLCE